MGEIRDSLEEDYGIKKSLTAVYSAFKQLGGQQYTSTKRPIINDVIKAERIEYISSMDKEHIYEFHQDEKWFYPESGRRNKKYIKKLGNVKKTKFGHRRYPTKVMFSAVVGLPVPEHNFEGKVFLKRVAKKKIASRRSWKTNPDDPTGPKIISHNKHDVYDVDCEMNSKMFQNDLILIGKALRTAIHWVSFEQQLYLQIDSAGGHGIARGHGKFEKLRVMILEKFNICLRQQPKRSPDS